MFGSIEYKEEKNAAFVNECGVRIYC